MYVVLVRIKVKPSMTDKFLSEMLLNSRSSLANEIGCHQFDVCQDLSEPNRIYLYEVYDDENAFQAHLETSHYLRWREVVKDFLDETAVSRRCVQIS
jgi:autoinducer 2-degrading protein